MVTQTKPRRREPASRPQKPPQEARSSKQEKSAAKLPAKSATYAKKKRGDPRPKEGNGTAKRASATLTLLAPGASAGGALYPGLVRGQSQGVGWDWESAKASFDGIGKWVTGAATVNDKQPSPVSSNEDTGKSSSGDLSKPLPTRTERMVMKVEERFGKKIDVDKLSDGAKKRIIEYQKTPKMDVFTRNRRLLETQGISSLGMLQYLAQALPNLETSLGRERQEWPKGRTINELFKFDDRGLTLKELKVVATGLVVLGNYDAHQSFAEMAKKVPGIRPAVMGRRYSDLKTKLEEHGFDLDQVAEIARNHPLLQKKMSIKELVLEAQEQRIESALKGYDDLETLAAELGVAPITVMNWRKNPSLYKGLRTATASSTKSLSAPI